MSFIYATGVRRAQFRNDGADTMSLFWKGASGPVLQGKKCGQRPSCTFGFNPILTLLYSQCTSTTVRSAALTQFHTLHIQAFVHTHGFAHTGDELCAKEHFPVDSHCPMSQLAESVTHASCRCAHSQYIPRHTYPVFYLGCSPPSWPRSDPTPL